jgi:hypothetical protein
MKLRWYGWLTVLAVLALLVNFYAFAGLRRVAGVGVAVAAQARAESPLTHTYIVLGGHILHYTPFMRGVADDLASSTWAQAYVSIRRNPGVALHLLDSASNGVVHALMGLVYWAPPILLMLALIGWLFRPRQVSLFNQRG